MTAPGGLLLVFQGRPKIAGHRARARLVAEGMVGAWGRDRHADPSFELVQGARPTRPRVERRRAASDAGKPMKLPRRRPVANVPTARKRVRRVGALPTDYDIDQHGADRCRTGRTAAPPLPRT